MLILWFSKIESQKKNLRFQFFIITRDMPPVLRFSQWFCYQRIDCTMLNQICVCCVCLVVQAFCDPMDCSPPGSSVPGIIQAGILEWVAISFSRDLPNPGIEPRSPALQADSLLPEPPGKPINTGVGRLSLSRGSSRPRN